MYRKLTVGTLAGFVLLSIGAIASDDLTYSYLQAEYVGVELDGGAKGDGFDFSASAEIGSAIHVFGGYGELAFDPFLGAEIDTATLNAGVGYHRAIGGRISLFGEVGYVDVDLDSSTGDVSDDGYSASIGIRGLVASSIELNGAISFVDLGDAGDDTAFSAGFLFNVNSTVSVGMGYTTSDDSDSLSVGVRVYMGKGR
jgi:hypothetical protein